MAAQARTDVQHSPFMDACATLGMPQNDSYPGTAGLVAIAVLYMQNMYVYMNVGIFYTRRLCRGNGVHVLQQRSIFVWLVICVLRKIGLNQNDCP